jgi:hypothetical protein
MSELILNQINLRALSMKGLEQLTIEIIITITIITPWSRVLLEKVTTIIVIIIFWGAITIITHISIFVCCLIVHQLLSI